MDSWTELQYQVSYLLWNSLKSKHKVVGYPLPFIPLLHPRASTGRLVVIVAGRFHTQLGKTVDDFLLSGLLGTFQYSESWPAEGKLPDQYSLVSPSPVTRACGIISKGFLSLSSHE